MVSTYEVVIPVGTQVPRRIEKMYKSMDNSDNVTFTIREGSDPVREKNKFLGQFILDVTARPKGVPLLARFEIDQDYNLLAGCFAVNEEDGTSVPIGCQVPLDMSGLDRRRAKSLASEFDKLNRVNSIASTLSLITRTLRTIARKGSSMDPSPQEYIEKIQAFVKEKNAISAQRWSHRLLKQVTEQSTRVMAVSSICSSLSKIKEATEEDRKVMNKIEVEEVKELRKFFGASEFTVSACEEAKKKAEEIWDTVRHGNKRSAPRDD